AGDHGWTGDRTDLCHLPQGHLGAARSSHEHAGQSFRTRSVLRGVADAHRKALTSFDGEGEVRLPDGRLDDVLNGAHRDAVPRGRLTVHPNVQIRGAGDLLWIHVRSAR